MTEETAPDGCQLCVFSDVTSLKINEADLDSVNQDGRPAKMIVAPHRPAAGPRRALLASITDPLTGLPNRRHVFARLEALMTEAFELRLPLTAAVIDLDMFKQINDRHGHGAGDSVLVAFARRVGATLRPRDVLGRIGGEEFLLVLMNTGRAGAELVLGDARTALRAGTLLQELPALTVDFSAGVTVAQPGDISDTLWQRADRGLFSAKAAGRGCDVFVKPAEPLNAAPDCRRLAAG